MSGDPTATSLHTCTACGHTETVEPLEYALDLLAAVDWPDCTSIRTGDWNIGRILLLIEAGRDVPELKP